MGRSSGASSGSRGAAEVRTPLRTNIGGGKTLALKVSELEGLDWPDGPVLQPLDIFKNVGIDWWNTVAQRFTTA